MDQELAAFCQAEHRRLVGPLSPCCQDRQVAEELAQDALRWSPNGAGSGRLDHLSDSSPAERTEFGEGRTPSGRSVAVLRA